MEIKSLYWTTKHKQHLKSTFENFHEQVWSFNLPVLILERSWLKLEEIVLEDLAKRLPPDNSQEAPELVRYSQLTRKGVDPLIAIQQCWNEFGIEDFHRALRKSWDWKDRGNNGWTYNKYNLLIKKYKRNVIESIQTIPLIVIPSRESKEEYNLSWLTAEEIL